ncbi:MAG: hypothetical protein HFI75_00085 [Lachnospiraceae bacterium]|nr:hypothetical protein [Lachnospiraceae bacterium]
MEKAEYALWYQRAKEGIDVRKVAEHYLQCHEVVQNYIGCIKKEDTAWSSFVYQLLNIGLEFEEFEDLLYNYRDVIQEVYLELGLKIGARLGAEKLC